MQNNTKSGGICFITCKNICNLFIFVITLAGIEKSDKYGLDFLEKNEL